MVRWAMETVIDLRNAGKKEVQPAKDPMRWKPPDAEVVKINIDAAFKADNNTGAIGLVVRNHAGVMLRAQSSWVEYAASPLAMEAEAVRAGTRLAGEMGI